MVYASAVEKLWTCAIPHKQSESCYVGTIDIMNAVTGIVLKSNNIRITQSRFERNKVGLGAVIYDEFGSDIMVFNTTFVNNSATQYCTNHRCFAGGIVKVNKSQESTVTFYHSKFKKNVGVALSI